MAVWYLDNDDEITDAVARLRGVSDDRVVFVVPPGSRIATGRINFKLLAREAASRDLRMAVASPDPQVRALAASAGVLARASAEEADAALERGDAPPTPRIDAGLEAVGPEPDEALASGGGAAALEASTTASSGVLTGWSVRRLTVSTIVVLALVVVGAVTALQILPTAEISLTPRTEAVGPLTVTVTATSSVTASDPASGRIPAAEVPIPLSVRGTFAASGTESIETRAGGVVVFSSPDQGFDQEIEAGTRVRTPSGVEFQTTAPVVLPRTTSTAAPSRVAAPIEAIASGPQGNVPAGTISIVPSLESQGISVANPAPTNGGRFEQESVVTQADYDAATVDLRNRLAGSLAAYLRDPAKAPEGLTLFDETARLGAVDLEPAVEELVGVHTESFEVRGSATARVLGVDERLVDAQARAALLAAVPEGMAVLDDTVAIEVGDGSAEGGGIVFRSRASGQAYQLVDADELRARMAGLPVSEARAILETLGTASVHVWPEFLDGLPADVERITIDVREPSTTE